MNRFMIVNPPHDKLLASLATRGEPPIPQAWFNIASLLNFTSYPGREGTNRNKTNEVPFEIGNSQSRLFSTLLSNCVFQNPNRVCACHLERRQTDK